MKLEELQNLINSLKRSSKLKPSQEYVCKTRKKLIEAEKSQVKNNK